MTNLDEYTTRCRDERCQVKSTCPLYQDRDNPQARVTANTLRQRWESHSIPCAARLEYFAGHTTDVWILGSTMPSGGRAV